MASSRLITLTGAGGSGKTWLAIEAVTGFAAGDLPAWVDLAPLHDGGLVADHVSRALEVHGEGVSGATQALHPFAQDPQAAAGARQLRAPGRRLRPAGPGAAAFLRAAQDPRHQPRAARPAGRKDLAGAAAGVARRGRQAAARGAGSHRRGASCSRRAPARRARLSGSAKNAAAVTADLPPARRPAAGARAGRRPHPGALGRADRRTARRHLPAADDRRPHLACRARKPCAAPSTGATTCSPRSSGVLCAGCRSSSAAFRSRRSSRWRPAAGPGGDGGERRARRAGRAGRPLAGAARA